MASFHHHQPNFSQDLNNTQSQLAMMNQQFLLNYANLGLFPQQPFPGAISMQYSMANYHPMMPQMMPGISPFIQQNPYPTIQYQQPQHHQHQFIFELLLCKFQDLSFSMPQLPLYQQYREEPPPVQQQEAPATSRSAENYCSVNTTGKGLPLIASPVQRENPNLQPKEDYRYNQEQQKTDYGDSLPTREREEVYQSPVNQNPARVNKQSVDIVPMSIAKKPIVSTLAKETNILWPSNTNVKQDSWVKGYSQENCQSEQPTKVVLDFSSPHNASIEDNQAAMKRKLMEDRLNRASKSTNQKKREFTKEEIFERKREVLKNARINVQQLLQQAKKQEDEQPMITPSFDDHTYTLGPIPTKVVKIDVKPHPQEEAKSKVPSKVEEPPVSMSKQDMMKLAQKNYELLPEVKRKKLEESKKEDLKKRMEQVKEFEKRRREQRNKSKK